MRRHVSNLGWTVFEGLASALVNVVVLSLVARALGPEPYGMYAYVFALAALVGMLGYLGLDPVAMRGLVTGDGRPGDILGTTLLLRTGGYLAAALLLLAYGTLMPGHSPTESALFAAAALFLAGQPLGTVVVLWFRAHSDLRTPSATNLLATLLGGGIKVAAVLAGLGVVAIGLSQTAAAFLASGLLLLAFLRRGGPGLRDWSVSRTRAAALLRDGWRLQVAALLAAVTLQIDIPLLRLLAGPEAAGEYAVAARLVAMTLIVGTAVAATAYPALVRAQAEGPEATARLLRLAFSAVTLAAYLVILGNAVLGGQVLRLLVGEGFDGTGPLVSLLVLMLPLALARPLVSHWATLHGRGGFLIWSEGLGAATVIGLNLLLVPRLGGTGAALAMLGAVFVASVAAKLPRPDTRALLLLQLRSLADPVSPFVRLVAARRSRG